MLQTCCCLNGSCNTLVCHQDDALFLLFVQNVKQQSLILLQNNNTGRNILQVFGVNRENNTILMEMCVSARTLARRNHRYMYLYSPAVQDKCGIRIVFVIV